MIEIQNLIDGKLTSKTTTGSAPFLRSTPYDERPLYEVTPAGPLDLVSAIKAAHANQKSNQLAVEQRIALLNNVADQVMHSAESLAQDSALDQGIPFQHALKYDVLRAAQVFRAFAKETDRKGHGLVAGISGRAWPLTTLAQIIAPALQVGSSIIVKPSLRVALAPFRLSQIIAELIPPAMVQFLYSHDVGELMASHPGIQAISFAGRTEVGRQILFAGAQELKPTHLRLSVKNSALVLDDADLDLAAAEIVRAAFTHSGQNNESISRVMVKESQHEELIAHLIKHTKNLVFGNPVDPHTTYGCMLDKNQILDLKKHTATATAEKGRVIQPLTVDHPQAFAPTIIQDLHNCSDLQQMDLFGPVLIVIPTKYLHESVKWANTTPYAYNALVFSKDAARVKKLTLQLDVNHIWWNQWQPENQWLPTTGFRLSGLSGATAVFSSGTPTCSSPLRSTM